MIYRSPKKKSAPHKREQHYYSCVRFYCLNIFAVSFSSPSSILNK